MEPTTLQLVWFGLIALFWTGYLVLDGFDLGVGMLLPVLGRDDLDRRVMINAIGPVWNGNEVWLITAGGMMFAAFPSWYGTLLSAFYLPVLLILAALIVRGVAFEYRGKVDSPRWRRGWDQLIVVGSAVPALLWGVAFGNLIRGIDATALYARLTLTPDGSAIDLAHSTLVPHPSVSVLLSALNPFALLTGATTTLLFAVHAAVFLSLRTEGPLRQRAATAARRLSAPLLPVAGVWVLWAQLGYGKGWTWPVVIVTALFTTAAVRCTWKGRAGRAFTFTSVVTAGAVVMVFASMYPDALRVTMPGADGGVHDVSAVLGTTIAASASSDKTLQVMAWVAAVMVPTVLTYQGWVYRVFRHRVSRDDVLAVPH